MLKLGTQNISALYVGGAKIKRALVGTEVVYEAVRPPAVYTISAVVAPASGGSVTGAGQYQEGETVTLTYTPAEDHRFTGWYAGSTLLSQANPYTFAAAQDIAVTAKCEEIPTYTLTLAPTGISAQNWSFSIAVNGSGVTWSGSGAAASSPAPQAAVVKEGSVTVQATSPDGYEFAGWQIGSGSVITSNPYTFTVTGDTTLYCRYAKKSRLPAGYTEVEYIQSSISSRYSSINLGVYLSNTSTFKIKGNIPAGYSTNSYLLYGYKYSGGYYYNNLYVTTAALLSKIGYFNSSSGTVTTIYSSTNLSGDFEITGDSNEKTITYNGVSTTVPVTFRGLGDMYLNGNGSSTASGFKGLKISYIKVTGTFSGEFIPCISPAGVVGLYNLSKNTFCGPVSTSYPWTAGPAV